jgi:hypothetical protein
MEAGWWLDCGGEGGGRGDSAMSAAWRLDCGQGAGQIERGARVLGIVGGQLNQCLQALLLSRWRTTLLDDAELEDVWHVEWVALCGVVLHDVACCRLVQYTLLCIAWPALAKGSARA